MRLKCAVNFNISKISYELSRKREIHFSTVDNINKNVKMPINYKIISCNYRIAFFKTSHAHIKILLKFQFSILPSISRDNKNKFTSSQYRSRVKKIIIERFDIGGNVLLNSSLLR